MKKNLKTIIFYLLFIVAVIVFLSFAFGNASRGDKTTYSDLVTLFQNEQVKKFTVTGKNEVQIVTKDDKQYYYELRDFNIFYYDFDDLILEQKQKGIIEEYDYIKPKESPAWLMWLPYILLAVISIALWIFMIRQATGGGKMNSFGKAKAKLGNAEKNKVRFTDVAGCDEEKQELSEVVDFLRNPTKYTKLGASIPHGVLLVGPPGTGKTLLAKAVAGEAGVPFYSISGSDFVEMYVGVGASRVRDLFETAKKNPASIVFIDEIDAVGRHRGAGLGGGHDEREQTLNQLLVEMDGFGKHDGVIVMAATNRPDILDPALLRPGRFDRQVTVGLPDAKGREDILKVHSKDKPFASDVDLKTVAKTTIGFTGADLANLLNEAALLAARKNKSLIGMEDIEEASIKAIVGTKKSSKVIKDEDKRLTAYHEAGHAIVTKIVSPAEKVHQISVIPSGRAAGYTLSLPKEENSHMRRSEMIAKIETMLGGRAAEKIIYGDVTTGASEDLKRATSVARSMVTRYGMSDDLGLVVYGGEHDSDEVFLGRDFNSDRNYSDETAAKIDDEIKKIIGEAFAKVIEILEANRSKLDFTAEFLVKHEIMDEDQFDALMTNDDVTLEDLEKIADDKRKQNDAENDEKRRQYESAEASFKAENGSGGDASGSNDNIFFGSGNGISFGAPSSGNDSQNQQNPDSESTENGENPDSDEKTDENGEDK